MIETIKRIFVCLITVCICYTKSQAQALTNNQTVRSSLDEMFENLDKSKVPSGFLLDYAMDLVEFNRYNGIDLTDSNYVTSHIFEELLLSIKSAAVGSSSLSDIGQIMSDFTATTTSNSINVAHLGYKYNFIKETALSENLISYVSGKVSDVYVNGVWRNPYDEAYVFAFTPSRHVCKVGAINFKFSETYAFYNISRALIKFDAGDGVGYRELGPTHTITVNYITPGRKELKFYIKTTDGVVLETHSSIYVFDSKVGTSENQQLYKIENRQADSSLVFASETYTGTTVSAQVTTYLREGHNAITKPFIVVEGFDPWRVTNLLVGPFEKPELGSSYHGSFMCSLDDSLAKDYDFIYVDWHDSTEDIRDNACLLVKIIKQINQRKSADGCSERTVILGQSMGGLVTRLALCMMEGKGEAHGISTYISHDSPHLGANVPLGALYFVHHLLSYIHGYQNAIDLVDLFREIDIDDIKRLVWELIHSPAAKQMLVNHLSTSGILDNSDHNNWQLFLDETGFPQGDSGYPMERLAIVNGFPNDQSDIFAELGLHYFYLDGYAKTSVLTDIIVAPLAITLSLNFIAAILGAPHLAEAISFWGTTKFDVHAEVNPFMTHGALISELRITYTKKFLWCINKTYNIFSEKAFAPTSGLRYDIFPGSKYKLANTPEMTRPYADTWFYKYDFQFGLTDRIMFIPSASALSIYDATESDYLRDYYIYPPVPEVECPFDAFYLANRMQIHIEINNNICSWLEKQLSINIIGPNNAWNGSAYTLSDYDGAVTWGTSDSNVATIDDSGRLTAHGNGFVTITAQSYNNGQLLRKKKTIFVGFPDIVIKSSYSAGVGYQFVAESTNNDMTQILNRMVAKGVFQYEWSLIDGDGKLVTKTTSSNVFSYLPSVDEEITIVARLVNVEGDKGPVKSLSYNLRTPMSVNYRYVVVDAEHNIYFITDDNTYEIGLPSEEFSATFRNLLMNSVDKMNVVYLRQKYLKGRDCYISYPYGIRMTGYMKGILQPAHSRWVFDFFNQALFLDELEDALAQTNQNERIIKDFHLAICNTNQEKLQEIPFVIIYKPNFPEN